MTKARQLADLLDASGDVSVDALDNVPPSNDASALTTGTLPVDRVPYVGRRNLIINGGFDVWQRGTSFLSRSAYTADRWTASLSYDVTTSRQEFTVGQTEVADNPKYYLRVAGGSTSNSAGASFLRYHIEGLKDTGSQQELTVSFWMRSSEATSVTLQMFDVFTWSSDLNLATEYTFNTTSTWTKFTHTFTTSNHTGKTYTDTSRFTFQFNYGNSLDSGDTVDIANVQLELGSVATPFEHRSYGEELALCQRYYQDITSGNLLAGHMFGTGSLYVAYNFPVRMRAAPTASYNGGVDSVRVWSAGSNGNYGEFLDLDVSGDRSCRLQIAGLSLTNGYGAWAKINDDSVLSFDAEL